MHVQDEETDWLVRDFARRRGLGITAAIKTAVKEASERELNAGELLAQKIEPLLKEVRASKGRQFDEDDKLFLDEMWGEPD
ncbi:MAG: type II toxin-antitoxin system VapB family antitoxin [Rhizobiaceae bacterium]|nr:type II toxin-antitoxin system VapB family antitoxin [Rhizobiaceae bacterium]